MCTFVLQYFTNGDEQTGAADCLISYRYMCMGIRAVHVYMCKCAPFSENHRDILIIIIVDYACFSINFDTIPLLFDFFVVSCESVFGLTSDSMKVTVL